MAVVTVSYELEDLVAICDRVLVPSRGEIAGQLAGDDITAPSTLQMAFRTREAA
jgi:ABC-type sugar transport system ATPase subunit